MRVLIYNNTMGFHCGSDAVMAVLTERLSKEAHQIVGLVPNVPLEYAPFVEMLSRPYDALVINGEGTLHHDSPGAKRISAVAEHCIRQGKQVYLINSVWQENTCFPLALLEALSGVSVREEMSRREIERFGFGGARRVLDLSYFCDCPEDISPAASDHTEVEMITDLFLPEAGFVVPPAELQRGRRYVSLKEVTWQQCVGRFRQATMVVTGRHHAVYAACKARTPFAAMRGNTHKIEGLILGSGIDIPVAQAPRDLEAVIAWCRNNPAAFEDLFDWMAAQTPWRGLSEFDS